MATASPGGTGRSLASMLVVLALPPWAAPRRPAVPDALTDRADVPGYTSRVRYFPREAEDVESQRQDISTLIQCQGIGDLYRIYSVTQRDDVEFNLAFIPATFNTPRETDFDTAYMRKLFDFGYGMAEAGYTWYKRPPLLWSGDEPLAPESP